MYLYTRNTRLVGGNASAGVEWAISVTGKVKQITGQEVELWATVYSPRVGTLTWTAWVEDLRALETIGDKLQVDPGFAELAKSGAAFSDGTLDDAVYQPLFGEVDPARQITYVSVVGAVCSGGNIGRALTIGVEIAETASKITGLPLLFTSSLTGPYGQVGWISGYESIEQLEKAQAALSADPSFLKLVDSSEGCFVEDAALTQNTIYRKIA